jgi:hypothetical protein
MTLSEVEDIATDDTFNVFINHRGDLGFVSGRDYFEQALLHRLTRELRDIIGRPDVERETITELAESKIQRIAAEMDELDSVAAYQASFIEDVKGTVLEIEVIYDTDGILAFEVEP